MDPQSRRYAWSSFVSATYRAEDRPAVREALVRCGISSQLVQQVIRDQAELDPEPSARTYLDAMEKADLPSLARSARTIYEAATNLANRLRYMNDWPSHPLRIGTPLGPAIIGTPGDDRYRGPAWLVIDPGGDDTYRELPSAVALSTGAALAVVLDLGGDDIYRGRTLPGSGSAVFGMSLLLDCSGDDHYLQSYSGSASAFGGVCVLEDLSGNDQYQGWAFTQAAAEFGVALLCDHSGDDRYDAGLCGQAFAGTRSVAWLIDLTGNDIYFAGGREPDFERHDDRFLSLAQGCAMGARPFAGGGLAMLLDGSGNDVYWADVYGQGVGYWYAVGALLDLKGNDSYRVYHYGQGAGIHLACGLLYDRTGSDDYHGHILCQGAAHDYAVGMLLEMQGDDVYLADHHSQARAINNGLALLVDYAGNDAYFAGQPDRCQGSGNIGGDREYGSLALLLDLAGRDTYSAGECDGHPLLRPMYGIIFDTCPAEETAP